VFCKSSAETVVQIVVLTFEILHDRGRDNTAITMAAAYAYCIHRIVMQSEQHS